MDDDGETTYGTLMFLCFNLKNTFICVNWWTRQRIHNTLIVVDRYLRIMGDQTIPVWNRFIPHSSQVSIYHIKV